MEHKIKVGQRVRVTCDFDNNTTRDKIGEVLLTWEDRALVGFFCYGVKSNSSLPDYKPFYKGLKATWSIPFKYLTASVSLNKFR